MQSNNFLQTTKTKKPGHFVYWLALFPIRKYKIEKKILNKSFPINNLCFIKKT